MVSVVLFFMMAWMPFSFVTGGWISVVFCRKSEEELILEVLDGQRLDEDNVDGGGDEGLHSGDGFGGDISVDHVVLGQAALVQGNSLGILFYFRGEEQVIVPTQQDGDLAIVGQG